MGILVVLAVFLIITFFKIMSNVKNDREWYEGVFENQSETTEERPHDPLLEAYIQLGALMVRRDTETYSEKILYLNSYFSKNFPHSHYDFGRSFTESLKDPVQPRVISKWLRRKLPHRKQRIQIMYFLAGLSTVDGSMNHREIELLKEMNTLLELSQQDFDSIIAMYTQKREEKQILEGVKPGLTAIQVASKVLGVSENASLDQVKKSYRRLVKLHHPDNFATETGEQQHIAHQRFIEIQKAYEVLVNKWN